MAFTDKARQRAYLNSWRRRNIERGLTAVGGQRYIRNYRHLTGHTIGEWQEQVNQHKIKWRDLPDIIKPRVRDTHRPKTAQPSRWRDKTGETLQEIADRLGLSREAVRRRLNQYGTAEPQHLRSYRKKVA